MPYVTCTDVESQIYDDDKSKSIIFYIEVTIDIILALYPREYFLLYALYV